MTLAILSLLAAVLCVSFHFANSFVMAQRKSWSDLKEEVQVKRAQRAGVREKVEKHLKAIFAELPEEKWRQSSLLLTGSAFEGLKVKDANEFDFMAPQIGASPYFTLSDSQQGAFLPDDGPNAQKFHDSFLKLVGGVPLKKAEMVTNGPAAMLEFSVDKLDCTVDLVPAMQVKVSVGWVYVQ